MTLKELIEKLNLVVHNFGDDLECIVGLEELPGILDYDLKNVYVSFYKDKGSESKKLTLFAPINKDEDMAIFQKE